MKEGDFMNIAKFTQNSQNSVNMAQQYAVEFGNQEIEEEHLLYALINIDDSLIKKLIEKYPNVFANQIKSKCLLNLILYMISIISIMI